MRKLRIPRETKVSFRKIPISWTMLKKNPVTYLKTLSVEQLVQIIDQASDAYYNTEKTLISDIIFDKVWDELKRRDPKNPRLKKVGAPVRKMGKVKLPFYLGSLDKLKPENADKWIENNPGPYVISDKMDGLSLGISQEKGTKLYTRGNGREGQDISHLVPYLVKYKKIPARIPEGMQIRAEIEMKESVFKKYFPEGKNARNQVSGLINQKNIDPNIIKTMEIIAYEIIRPAMTPSAQLKKLKALKFQTTNFTQVKSMSSSSLSNYLKIRKSKSHYAIDGLVIYRDIKAPRIRSGNPKHAVAFKMMSENDIVSAKVLEVIWTPSKHRYLKPRIRIEPTLLSGVTVKYATGFNAGFIFENSIGPGAIVRITRSGDVIPHIIKVIKPARQPQMPDYEYEWNDSHIDIKLPDNIKSKTVELKKLNNFFSTIGVEGFKLKTMEKLYNEGYDTIPKIINITVSELIDIQGIQQTSAEKLKEEINKSISNIEIHLLAFGSGVFNRTMGSTRLKEIFERYPEIHKRKFKKDDIIDMISVLPGYSMKTASDFAEGLPKFINFLRDLPRSVKITEPKQVKRLSNKMEGESIVFTGFRDKDLEEIIKENGGEIGSGISSKTTILLLKDVNSTSSKVRKAKERGILLMTPDKFRTRYNI